MLGSVVAAVVLGVASTSSSAASSRATLKGSAPGWAKQASRVGAADPAAAIGFRVYLGWKSGADTLARAVSDPRSSSYGHYLSASEFRRPFAPSQVQVGAVQSWLRGQGFKVDYTPQNNHYVEAEGTVAQAQTAFGTPFAMYQVNGKTVRSPSADVSVPSELAASVAGVIGLDESWDFVETNHVVDKNAPPSAGFRNAPPLSRWRADLLSPYAYPAGFTAVSNPATVPWSVKGNTPEQIKGAYGISGFNGSGQTVAVIDAYASPTIVQDVNQWSTNRGLPTLAANQFTQSCRRASSTSPRPSSRTRRGGTGRRRSTSRRSMAWPPAARIVYVGAPNNRQDLDAAMNHVVDKQLAQIVTNSYGFSTELLPPGYVKPLNDTFIQAAAEGIGVYFSSGDNGDETARFGFATPDWPAVSPWVTAVGGAALGVTSANLRAIETGWGTSNYNCNSTTRVCTRTGWLYGAGGGVSRIFAKPFYQSGLSLSGRGIPDVAALGEPQTGMLVGQTQTFPTGRSTTSTASAARASRARSSPG